MEKGTAAAGMAVAEIFRRNRKITITTMQSVSSSVNSTSRMDPRMDCRKPYGRTVAVRHDDGAVRGRVGKRSARFDGEGLLIAIEAAGGKVGIAGGDRVLDFVDPDVVGGRIV